MKNIVITFLICVLVGVGYLVYEEIVYQGGVHAISQNADLIASTTPLAGYTVLDASTSTDSVPNGLLNSSSTATSSAKGSAAASTTQPTMAVDLYYIALNDAGANGDAIGCGDSVIPIEKTINYTATPLSAALGLLLSDHSRWYENNKKSGLSNALAASSLSVQSVNIQSDIAIINLKGKYVSGGECDDPRIVAQIEKTVMQFPNVTSAQIFINGRLLQSYASAN